jgi:predicted acylesterase/phospholipase RssA
MSPAGNMAADATRPRVLCLDGGGIRGLSEILILKELMLQVRIHNGLDYTPEPYQCFDFICGTSTGGLVAVLLGRLGKTLDECEGLFRKLGSDIFESSSLLKSSRLVLKGSRHTGESLAEAIRAQAGHDLMYDKDCPSTGHVPVSLELPDTRLLAVAYVGHLGSGCRGFQYYDQRLYL